MLYFNTFIVGSHVPGMCLEYNVASSDEKCGQGMDDVDDGSNGLVSASSRMNFYSVARPA